MIKTFKIHADYWSAGNERQKLVSFEDVVPAVNGHEAIRIAVALAKVHEFKPHKNHAALGYLSVCRLTVGQDPEETFREDPPLFEWHDYYLLDVRRFADAVADAAEVAEGRGEPIWD